MNIFKAICFCICIAGVTQSAWSQKASETLPGIPGYLNPKTGAFRPMPQRSAEEVEPATTVVVGGKFVVNFTITVASSIPTSDPIMCGLSAYVFDSRGSIIEENSVTATRTGNTATCSVTIPYSWTLTSPTSSDTVDLSYTISGASRYSSQTIADIAVPPNGATTTETVKATI